MPLNDPVPASDRGFMEYGGAEPLVTDYGHQLQVRESSAAMRRCVWIFVKEFPEWYQAKLFAHFSMTPGAPMPNVGIHMTVRQTVELIGRLEQFLADCDLDEVIEAKKAVYG